jgi:hypothetical protein
MNLSKIISTKVGRLAAAGVIAAGAVVGVAVAANAAGGTGCATLTYPLCARSVAKTQVVDNSLDDAEFTPATRAKLNKPVLAGAYYSVAFYDKGDTNAGAIATAACKAATDVAISGGAQTVGLDATANTRNTPVNSSFPGRMDWTTNAPKAGRLDGWIVQFGGNAGATSDKAPEKVKVWALCVPGLSVPVEQTYLQSQDG